ncbi:MAG: adenylylsulfate reductase subunit alpha, partial [bacterium]
TFSENIDELAAEIFLPMETWAKHSGYSTDPSINPHYIRPAMLQQRLQKAMDEYVGGVGTWYVTSKTMLDEGFKYLDKIKEDSLHMAAENLHELLRAWENHHRILTAEAHAKHIYFREETRYPGYYYRGDHLAIDDENWKCFVNSTYDKKTGTWNVFKKTYHQLIP